MSNTNNLWSSPIDKENNAVWNHCLKVANGNKEWANRKNAELKGKKWEASEMSVKMLEEYSTKTIEELADHDYRYLRLRSHSFHGNFPIDPHAYNLWIVLTGKEPQKATE